MRSVHGIDATALMLGDAARFARTMPPSWDGGQCITKLYGCNGYHLGDLLPGRGLALAHDLAAFRITRPIPHVYEASALWRTHDKLGRWAEELAAKRLTYRRRGITRLLEGQRGAIELVSVSPEVAAAKSLAAAITTYDGIISARANGKFNDVVMSKASLTTVAQSFSSLFRAGGLPVAGTYTNIPTGAAHDRSSVGAWNGIRNPTGTDQKYLLTAGPGSSSVIDWCMLIDLLVAAGNINANATGNQTVSSAALPRVYGSTDGAGVMVTFEITTALGATPANITVNSYTDQDGNAASTTPAVAMTASGITFRLQPTALGPFIELASGDWGVRAISTVVMSAAMGAGVIALNMYYPLAFMPGLAANMYYERDSTVQIDGLTELIQGASDVVGCLTWFVQTNSTTSGVFKAFARTCEG